MPLPYYLTWTAQAQAVTLPVVGARESYFVLGDGREVEDLVSTSFQASFGHSAEAILAPMRRQLEASCVAFAKATSPQKRVESERLLAALGLGGGRIFYTVSGAEAIENALKMARQFRARPLVAARERSYHGASLGALSVTGDWRREGHFLPEGWTLRIPEPHDDPEGEGARERFLEAGPERIAALCVETVSGANGVIVPPSSWWRAMRTLCDDFGILLVLDEVVCGFGRTGKTFGFQHEDLRPDMVCLAKAISGGYVPFGALWTSEAIAQFYERQTLSCGLTNYAHPLGLAAMSGVLDLLDDPAFHAAQESASQSFDRQLQALAARPYVRALRHIGMLAALDLEIQGMERAWPLLVQAGVHVLVKGQSLILAPPLNIAAPRLEAAMATLLRGLDALAA